MTSPPPHAECSPPQRGGWPRRARPAAARALFVVALLACAALAAAAEQLVLRDGRRISVNWLARRDGKVVFETTRGEVFSVPETEVVAPPLEQIPARPPERTQAPPPPAQGEQMLVLRDGRRIRVLRLGRRGGRVLLQTIQGESFSVPEADVVSPPLDAIPVLGEEAPPQEQVLVLRDGRQIRVQRLGRRDGLVVFQTITGEGFSVAEDQVVSPPLEQIPQVGAAAAAAPPSEPPAPAEPPAPVAPAEPAEAAAAGAPAAAPAIADFDPFPDRWAVPFPESPRSVRGRALDPYNQNLLKGDKSIIGDSVFFVLQAILDTPFEARRTPLVGSVSTAEPGSFEFFGQGEQLFFTPRIFLTTELFKGQTAFKPKKWALRVTPAFNFNYLKVRENNVVNADVREGPRDRARWDFSLEEAFAEYELLDFEPHYDSISVRAGIQPFVSDFRGFVFLDFNLGARLFGNLDNNRWQFNVAGFDLLEKDTNSELNTFEKREQKVLVANVFRQDFLAKGYQLQASFHWSRDEADVHYDKNGILVRPAPVGLPRPHEVTAQYAGLAGDGHIGRLNLTHAFYWVFGDDERNVVAGRETEIEAQFGALEASVDKDWARFKASFAFASGDGEPLDGRATGFDAIYDNPNFAGGPFSFWTRSAILLTQTKVTLKPPLSLLPSLRSNKFEGQANYVNPGLLLAGVGVDVELTPKLKLVTTANYLRFHKTETLETLLFQPNLDNEIGLDLGAGVLYRPFLNENLVITAGLTGLVPGRGFKQIYSSDPCGAPGCGAESQSLYNIFALARFVW